MAVGAPIYASLPTLTSGDGITWTCSITLPSGTDQLLLVCASHDDGKSISSLSWNGSSPTAYLSGTAWGYWLAPATGSRTLTVVISAYSSRPPRVQVACFDSVHQTAPVGTLVVGSTPSSTPSTGSITCPSGGTVYGVLLHAFSTTDPSLTAGTGAGSPASAHSDSGWGYAHAYRESTGALSWSCSNSGSTYVAGVPINSASGGDTTAPTLTSPTGTGGTLTCSGSVSTDEGNGTLYAVFTASATAPSAAQIKAGQDHTGSAALRAVSQAVSGTGSQNIASGAVTAGTRYVHFMHEDAATNQSTVASSASFIVSAVQGTATINDWVKNNGTTHSNGEVVNISFHNPTTRALVVYVQGATVNAGADVVVSDPLLVAGTTYLWIAESPTNNTWFASGRVTAS